MINTYSKEELKQYGIYMILNTITNDFYIGSTIQSFSVRLSRHKSSMNFTKQDSKKPGCVHLVNAVLKYGKENFEFKILRNFVNKKDSKRTKEIIVYLEEKYITNLNPKYNICKKPTKGGCPNLDRKLTDIWKQRIGEKAKLYKHSDNLEQYYKIIEQNKEGSSIYKITKNNEVFIGSVVECVKHFNIDPCSIFNAYNKKYKSTLFDNIEKLKSQKKKIKLYLENEEKIFNSYNECDRFLNRWRGYTSTQIVNNKNVILKYKYELINEDIV